MTIQDKRKRSAAVVIATAVTTLMLVAATAGILTSVPATAEDDSPEHVEKLVTDFSKYVMLHQTRGENSRLSMEVGPASCAGALAGMVAHSSESI